MINNESENLKYKEILKIRLENNNKLFFYDSKSDRILYLNSCELIYVEEQFIENIFTDTIICREQRYYKNRGCFFEVIVNYTKKEEITISGKMVDTIILGRLFFSKDTNIFDLHFRKFFATKTK